MTEQMRRTQFACLYRGALAVIVALVVARLAVELAGMPPAYSRYFSSSVGVLFVAIYLAAVGPLRGGLQKFSELLLPAVVLAAWTQVWVILATVIAAVFHLRRSHFALKEDFGNWGHLGRHVLGHVIAIGPFFVVVLILMALVRVLWRWPVTVAPGAFLGVFVIMRFWTEVIGLSAFRTAAWSSTLLVLLSGFYLGGIGVRMGLGSARQLLVPSLVVAWAWRAWVYLATVLSALVPAFRTHFFNPSAGPVVLQLLRALAQALIEGLIVGMLLWGIAVWMAHATRPAASAEAS